MEITLVKGILILLAFFISTTFVFGLFIQFIFGLRKYTFLIPVFGLALCAILLSWIDFFSLIQHVKTIFLVFFAVLGLLISYFLLIKKFYFDLDGYLKTLVLYILSSFMVSFFFLFPQFSEKPYIPSYEVNHDPIVIISIAKIANENSIINSSEFHDHTDLIVNNGYPKAFINLLVLFAQISDIDYYNLAPVLNIFIYSSLFFPLYFIMKVRFRINDFLAVAISLFATLSYVAIQTVNQSFYQQVMLTPLLYSALLIIYDFMLEKKNSLAVLAVFLLAASTITYSFSYLFWLIIPVVFVLINFISKRKFFALVRLSLFTAICLAVLLFPFLNQSIKLSKIVLSEKSQEEASMFTMKGNSIGFASIHTIFNTWFSWDYRIAEIDPTLYKKTVIFTLVLLAIGSIAFVKLERKNKVFITYLVVSFGFPIVFFRFFTDSPYLYNKTLYYAAPISVLLICLAIVLVLKSIKNKYLNMMVFVFFSFLLFGMVNNSMRALFYLGKPPLALFNEFKVITNELKNRNIDFVTIVDEEDWAKYYFLDFGSCIVFARNYNCSKNITKSEDSYILDEDSHFVVHKKYLDIIISEKESIFETQNYIIL